MSTRTRTSGRVLPDDDVKKRHGSDDGQPVWVVVQGRKRRGRIKEKSVSLQVFFSHTPFLRPPGPVPAREGQGSRTEETALLPTSGALVGCGAILYRRCRGSLQCMYLKMEQPGGWHEPKFAQPVRQWVSVGVHARVCACCVKEIRECLIKIFLFYYSRLSVWAAGRMEYIRVIIGEE